MFLSRSLYSNFRRLYLRNNRTFQKRQKSSGTKTIEAQDDAPIAYTKSPALKWKASYTRLGRSTKRLWFEPFVVLGSTAIFLLYFCFLREENDVDQELSRSLYSRIEGLEEKQLDITLKYNQEKGLDTTDIKNRIKELEELKKAS